MTSWASLITLLQVQDWAKTHEAGWDQVHTLVVAADVWNEIMAKVPTYDGLSAINVKVLVDRSMVAGQMIPLDKDGNFVDVWSYE